MIDQFKGRYYWLSNFWVEWDKKTVEHRFQAAKATNHDDFLFVMDAPTPSEAKRRGRQIALRPDWEIRKPVEMRAIVYQKFQEPDLRAHLIATEGHELVEGNYWHDQYWGNCLCATHKDIPGNNWLGIILMSLRRSLAWPY